MIFLINQTKANIESANTTIANNMGFSGSITNAWDIPKQVNAASGEGIGATPAHPVYIADPSKLNWWAIQKPEQRFMVGVSLTEITV